jgi:(p)ppGpp synthase/HD superfamily hydrolase
VIDRAIQLAARSHAGQFRKDRSGGHPLPYITHPLEVLKLVWKWGATTEVVACAAVLHDTMEDTSCRSMEIIEATNDEVYNIVRELTWVPEHEIPKSEYLAAFMDPKKKSINALTIKLADRICNVMDFHLHDPEYSQRYLDKASCLKRAWALRKEEFQYLTWNQIGCDWASMELRILGRNQSG